MFFIKAIDEEGATQDFIIEVQVVKTRQIKARAKNIKEARSLAKTANAWMEWTQEENDTTMTYLDAVESRKIHVYPGVVTVGPEEAYRNE